MSDLRKAAEMALKDWLANDEGVVRFGMELKPEWVRTVSHGFLSGYEEALRQALAQPEQDYERGFIDGMQKQMQSTVEKAVNAMTKREWVGLTREEIDGIATAHIGYTRNIYKAIEAKLKEKNT